MNLLLEQCVAGRRSGKEGSRRHPGVVRGRQRRTLEATLRPALWLRFSATCTTNKQSFEGHATPAGAGPRAKRLSLILGGDPYRPPQRPPSSRSAVQHNESVSGAFGAAFEQCYSPSLRGLSLPWAPCLRVGDARKEWRGPEAKGEGGATSPLAPRKGASPPGHTCGPLQGPPAVMSN